MTTFALIHVIASLRPARKMVFLGALVPLPGRPFSDYLTENPNPVIYDWTLEGERGPSGQCALRLCRHEGGSCAQPGVVAACSHRKAARRADRTSGGHSPFYSRPAEFAEILAGL